MISHDNRRKPKNKSLKRVRAQFDDRKLTRSQHIKNRMNKLRKQLRRGTWESSYSTVVVKRYNLSDAPLDYPKYLESDYWKKLRKRVLWKRNSCERCGTTRRLTLHHRYYYRNGKSVLYREQQFDDIFEVLCWPCHERHHRS